MSVAVEPHPLLLREEHTYPYALGDRLVAITGGSGSIGAAIRSTADKTFSTFDISHKPKPVDILDYDALLQMLDYACASVVIHAAANKHAPEGESHPYDVADLNVRGTENVVRACRELGIERLVFVSTCKAAQPETVYGASKLVGERIVLNAGYTVARLYNVVESSRNVFDIWSKAGKQIGVAQCSRFFITLDEAVSFILSCVDRDPGRFVPDASQHRMLDIAERWSTLHPGVTVRSIPPRRGDRQVEPRWADHERGYKQEDGSFKVVSAHDR
jgi:FlaA1/EpsC-like NDP-sugar epimerase